MRTGGQRSSSPQLMRFSNESPQLKQALPPLYRTRQPRYTSQHTSGHRQVVRHQLPKLTLAGSSPVARSKKAKARHHHGAVLFFNKAPGLEPDRVRALSKREAFVASRRRRRQAPEAGADLRSKYADVPLPAPSSAGDLGRDNSTKSSHRFRESEEIDRSRCGFAKQMRRRPVARSISRGRFRERQIRPVSPPRLPGPRFVDRSRCGFAKQIRGCPHARSNSKMLG